MPLSNEARKALDEMGYTHPTPVQRAIYEPAKRGRDLVVQARTGTGKTAAFSLPLTDGLIRADLNAVQAMVLCPTRELALQVAKEVSSLGKYRQLKVVSIYGGAPMQRQIDQIQAGAQILVGTPGRVLDHLKRGTLKADKIKVLVLDESDEMLSMGFLPQINQVLEQLPKNRQILLFSATMPREVVRMAEERLKDPSFITLSGDAVGALEIQHFVYRMSADKLSEFMQVVETENPESAIVFCNTRDQTKRVAAQLQQAGYAAAWINADLAQSERERVMAEVRESKLRFLVATDVAARGIDISHLTHVINYDFPESTEVYVHRTGRTGRAGRTGTAISLISPQDVGGVYLLKLTYRIVPVERSLPSARELRTRAELDLVESLVKLAEGQKIHADDRALARRLLTHDRGELVIAMLLRDHLGPREVAQSRATEARKSAAGAPAPAQKLPPPQPRETRRPEPALRESKRPEPARQLSIQAENKTPPQATAASSGGELPLRQERPARRDQPSERERASERPRRESITPSDKPAATPSARQLSTDKPQADGPAQARAESSVKRPERAQDAQAPRDGGPRSAEPRSRERSAPPRRQPAARRANFDDELDFDLPSYTVEDASPVAATTPAANRTAEPRRREFDERPSKAQASPNGEARGAQQRDAGPKAIQPREAAPKAPQARDRNQATDERPGRPSSVSAGEERAPRYRKELTAEAPERPSARAGELRAKPAQRAGDSEQAQRAEAALASTPSPKAPREAQPPTKAQPKITAQPTPTTSPASHEPQAPPSPASGPVKEIRIDIGRKNGARPSDIRQALSESGLLHDADTEHVQVKLDHSLVGVKQGALERALNVLNSATIAGQKIQAELS